MPNGIDLILADHRTIDALFAGSTTLPTERLLAKWSANSRRTTMQNMPRCIRQWARSLAIADMITRSSAAHSAVKKQIDTLTALEGAPLVEAFKALRKIVQRHVTDEEKNILPALGEAATPQQLEALGARILQAKQRVG